jgi:hypothetical protein
MRRRTKISFISAIEAAGGVRAMTQDFGEAGSAEDADASQDPLHFLVGQDHSGLWVVTETHGLYGGIFCSKDAALRFAKFETADRDGDCAVTAEPLEFKARRRASR